jgi:hypothetical protein
VFVEFAVGVGDKAGAAQVVGVVEVVISGVRSNFLRRLLTSGRPPHFCLSYSPAT